MRIEKILEQRSAEIKVLSRTDLERAFLDCLRNSLKKTEIIRELENSRCQYCKSQNQKIAV